jgi:hypothetical protein
MTPDFVFSAANTAALAAWLALILLPRWQSLTSALLYGLIGALSTIYAAIVAVTFFGVEGGGFNSIGEVRALFASDWMLTAGWIHYLAFDLFVGLWIAARADAMGINRLFQAPILVLTFLFGPLGLLIWLVASSVSQRRMLVSEATS